jgi:hypothetical protein
MPPRSRVNIAAADDWFEQPRSRSKLDREESVTSVRGHMRLERRARPIRVLPWIQGADERGLELKAHAWRQG